MPTNRYLKEEGEHSAVLKDEFAAAREQVWSMPIESIDVSDPEVHKNDTVGTVPTA